MLNFLFDFNGRIRRTYYCLGALAVGFVSGMLEAQFLGANWYGWRHGWYFGGDNLWGPSFPLGFATAPAFWLAGSLVGLACIWARLALAAKRWHDAGASGWLALLSLIPGVHLILFLILCLIPPTPGANQYGADPRTTPAAA